MVNETYLWLVEQKTGRTRQHFFSVASRIIRHVLVDARPRGAGQREHDRAQFEEALNLALPSDVDIVAVRRRAVDVHDGRQGESVARYQQRSPRKLLSEDEARRHSRYQRS